MIKLIVGLGNPGQQYQRTRHNAGFLLLDRVASFYGAHWQTGRDFQSLLSEFFLQGQKIVLQKPQLYMNKSGLPVASLAKYYKIQPEEILVVHDELDFDEGIVRLKKGGGHAGHNGLRNIILHLGSRDFYRLRVGIGRPVTQQKVADYVLSAPSRESEDKIAASFDRVLSCMNEGGLGKMDQMMKQLNSKD